MKLTPTPSTAAVAGAFSGLLMPTLWVRFGSDSISLAMTFLLVVVLPAHALVVGLSRNQTASDKGLDIELLKRVGAWLGAAVLAVLVSQAVLAPEKLA